MYWMLFMKLNMLNIFMKCPKDVWSNQWCSCHSERYYEVYKLSAGDCSQRRMYFEGEMYKI